MRIRRTERQEDPTPWIGYADFLMTVAILFLVMAVVLGSRNIGSEGPAVLAGLVQDSASKRALSGCSVRLGTGQDTTTDNRGSFVFRLSRIRGTLPLDVTTRCERHDQATVNVVLHADSTVRVDVRLTPRVDTADIRVVTIAGDALFRRNEWTLTSPGVDLIREKVGPEARQLGPQEVIAVQGHTDDLPFPMGAGKDNWVLSGERASAAARVLTDPRLGIGLRQCQVVIMGFGSSRPKEPVRSTDSPAEREAKRTNNRRIEFWRLRGSEIAGGSCD